MVRTNCYTFFESLVKEILNLTKETRKNDSIDLLNLNKELIRRCDTACKNFLPTYPQTNIPGTLNPLKRRILPKLLNIDTKFIGQFGVGFYSVFLVADKVEIITRSYSDNEFTPYIPLWVNVS